MSSRSGTPRLLDHSSPCFVSILSRTLLSCANKFLFLKKRTLRRISNHLRTLVMREKAQLVVRLTSLCPRCFNCPRRDKRAHVSARQIASATPSDSPENCPLGVGIPTPHHKRPGVHGPLHNVKVKCYCDTMERGWRRVTILLLCFQISEPNHPNAKTHGC